jgi:hypothetical protein
MRQIKLKLAALGAAVVLAACGGGNDGVNFDSTVLHLQECAHAGRT